MRYWKNFQISINKSYYTSKKDVRTLKQNVMRPQCHDSLKIECRGKIVTTNNLYQTQRKGTFEKPEMSPYQMEPNS